MKQLLKSQDGFAALIALLLVGMLTLLGIVALSTTEDEMNIAGNQMRDTRAFYAAEAGLERAAAELQTEYIATGLPPTTMPSGVDSLNGCVVTYVTIEDTAASGQQILTNGTFSGLHALVTSFRVVDTATNIDDKARVAMSHSFETALVPIFQFAVFYENELQASPAYGMDIDGRVHVNGDMWLNGWSTHGIQFTDQVTCAGGIYRGLMNAWEESGAPANVFFRDDDANMVNWIQGGDCLDATDADWVEDASNRWNGWVQDSAFGQEELSLPLTSADPHAMVEPKAGNPDSYELLAGLKVIDGVPYYPIDTNWIDITDSLPANTVTSTVDDFYDGHETKWVRNTTLDLGLLASSDFFPSNGVIYVADERSVTASTMNGFTVSNCTDIGDPLTMASYNPVYVEGDYNTVDKQPSAIIADACTFLSNQWVSTNKAKSHMNYNNRSVSSQTTVNVSFVTGDLVPATTSGGGGYGGGLENLPRFLEHWNGKTFKLRGSMICLWRSEQADGIYKYKGNPGYYSAPFRDWGFDHDLDDPANLPPETPMVRVFQRTGWQQAFVGYDD